MCLSAIPRCCKGLRSLCESLEAVPDRNGVVRLRRDASVVPSADGVSQSEQVGELGDADGLRVYVVLVDWSLIWTTRGVADVIFKDEVVEPNSTTAAILGAIIKGA